jgi:hypothetical protein
MQKVFFCGDMRQETTNTIASTRIFEDRFVVSIQKAALESHFVMSASISLVHNGQDASIEFMDHSEGGSSCKVWNDRQR